MSFAPVAAPFAPDEVQLLAGPFELARQRNARYLLGLDPDRLLHNTCKLAGLEPKGPLYGGWESRGIAGHTLGHYLTALAQEFASTGDAQIKARLDYLIAVMDACQELYGDGYIGALPELELATLRALKQGVVVPGNGFFFDGGAWVPWYTQHKVLAGLKDAWVLGQSATAHKMTLLLADWIDDLTAGLSEEQCQLMLQVEFGGLSETLAEIYALTGDGRYLATANRFRHHCILNPLREGQDTLQGLHANTQIPKIIGEARLYELTGEASGRAAAEYFWRQVVEHHSYAIGGNSEYEHFGAPDHLSHRLGPTTAETCNTYNMLKLTRHLFRWQPRVEYFDYYERALYNHILPSQDPERGMFTYFMSLKPGHYRTFSNPDDSFWCCVGSGLENHTKYNDSIYFHSGDELYINLFVPSRLNWTGTGLQLEVATDYPRGGQVKIRILAGSEKELTLNVRCPAWCPAEVTASINGQGQQQGAAGSYLPLRRHWACGDVITLSIPLGLRSESLGDEPHKLAFLYGPLVLAGDFGPPPDPGYSPWGENNGVNFHRMVASVPELLGHPEEPASLLAPLPEEPACFASDATSSGERIVLRPFVDLPFRAYNVYWNVFTPEEYREIQVSLEAEKQREQELAARTLDEYRPGEQQSEVDHNITSHRSNTGDFLGRKFRNAEAGGWFEVDANLPSGQDAVLKLILWGGDTEFADFEITVNGTTIEAVSGAPAPATAFFERYYTIPAAPLAADAPTRLRFEAPPATPASRVFNLRLLSG